MYANLMVIAIVLGIAYASMMRGFFSSFLNMICAVTAGAVAFGLWEPVSHMIMGMSPKTGMFGFIYDSSFAIGLALPFAATFALLRLGVDRFLGANIQVGTLANQVGGAACGAVAGVVTAGMVILSIGFTRMGPDMGLGYARVDYGTQGNLKRGPSLWLPADRIVAGVYGSMSEASLRTSTPLARMYPALDEVGAALRNTGSAKVRNLMDAADLKLLGRYTLEGAPGAPLTEILEDSWSPKPQQPADLNGDPFPAGSRIEGFVVNFGSGAKETFGQTVVGSPQVRLVAESEDYERIALHPIAVICQGDATDTRFGRFRFDQRDTFVGSVGGASDVRMGFDFVVPPGFTPIGLYVKNVRIDLEDEEGPKPTKFTSSAERDNAVKSGQIIGVNAATDLDTEEAKQVTAKRANAGEAASMEGIEVGTMLGLTIQRSSRGGLVVSDNNLITDGEQIFDPKELKERGERNQEIRNFGVTPDTMVVKVDVSAGQASSLLGGAVQAAEQVVPPVLIDDKNQQFEAIGYIYQDKDKVVVRYTPGRPIRGMAELDQARVGLSRARSDQKLQLIFRPSLGVNIKAFAFGTKVVTEFSPPVPVRK